MGIPATEIEVEIAPAPSGGGTETTPPDTSDNTDTTPPDTGDETETGQWVFTSVLFLVGVAALCLARYRKLMDPE